MRIGIDCRPLSSEKTGIGYYLWEILNHWGKNDIPYELILYSALDFEIPPQLAASHVHYRKRVFRMRPAEAWMHTILPIQLRMDRVDVYWGPNYAMPLVPFGAPSVLTVHDMVYRIFPETMKRVTYLHNRYGLERYVRRCNHIITDSENTKRDLVGFLDLPVEKIEVVPLGVSGRFALSVNSVSDDVIMKNLGLEQRSYLLTVGTLEPRKNLTRVIKAYKLFMQDQNSHCGADTILVVVGAEGWGDTSAEVRRELGEKIKYMGYVSDEMLGALYRHARGFVYMSLYEGFGLPPLEAMSCGTPVLVSNTSSLPEVVENCGLYADPTRVEDIAHQMRRLCDDDVQVLLATAGRARAEQMQWGITADKTLSLLCVIGERRG